MLVCLARRDTGSRREGVGERLGSLEEEEEEEEEEEHGKKPNLEGEDEELG